MPTVATWQNVAVAVRRPSSSFTPEEQAQINYWLAGVELLIKSRLGPIAELDQDTVRYVETEVVAEKVRRAGRAESSVTVTVDDATVTRRYDSVHASDVTAELWALFGSGHTASAYSIGVTSPVDVVE